jgi:hypothetical protein
MVAFIDYSSAIIEVGLLDNVAIEKDFYDCIDTVPPYAAWR